MQLATPEEIETIKNMALKVNDVMKEFFKTLNINLIDFKLEFGRYHGQIVRATRSLPIPAFLGYDDGRKAG